MAVNKYINLSVDELKVLRGHFIQKSKPNDLNGLSLGQMCTDFDPYMIALFNCEKCNKQPEIKGLIKKRNNVSVVKWTVTCTECKKSHQYPARTEALAKLSWNEINLKSQDYRQIPTFKLANLNTDEALGWMSKVRVALEIKVALSEIEWLIARAKKKNTRKEYAFMHRMQLYLHWSLLALRLIRFEKQRQNENNENIHEQ
jgi:hypothetical protein